MRNVPPGIQIDPSRSEEIASMETSALAFFIEKGAVIFGRCLPIDIQWQSQKSTEEPPQRDIGPWCYIEPPVRFAIITRMRRIQMVQKQEDAAEHGGALEAGNPIPLAQGQHDRSRGRGQRNHGGNFPMDCHR